MIRLTFELDEKEFGPVYVPDGGFIPVDELTDADLVDMLSFKYKSDVQDVMKLRRICTDNGRDISVK